MISGVPGHLNGRVKTLPMNLEYMNKFVFNQQHRELSRNRPQLHPLLLSSAKHEVVKMTVLMSCTFLPPAPLKNPGPVGCPEVIVTGPAPGLQGPGPSENAAAAVLRDDVAVAKS